MSNNNLKFVTNNVKGLQSTHKRLKMFEYFRNVLSLNGIIFLQETHSSINDEKTGVTNLKGNCFFLMEKPILVALLLGISDLSNLQLKAKRQIMAADFLF